MVRPRIDENPNDENSFICFITNVTNWVSVATQLGSMGTMALIANGVGTEN